MAIDVERFIVLRPYLYHVTARENRSLVAASMQLEPAMDLLRRAGRLDLARWRRPESLTLALGHDQVVLKDQRPLIEANISLDGAWDIGDFVQYLNEHVFFWPGRADGPIAHGVRLLGRYESDAPCVLRVPTRDLLDHNPDVAPLFCPFNSGAPRQNGGRRARRGPQLFAPAAQFGRRESEVVEVAFRSTVVLPDTTEHHTAGGWVFLRSRAA